MRGGEGWGLLGWIMYVNKCVQQFNIAYWVRLGLCTVLHTTYYIIMYYCALWSCVLSRLPHETIRLIATSLTRQYILIKLPKDFGCLSWFVKSLSVCICMCVCVCLSPATFVVSFSNGFGWNLAQSKMMMPTKIIRWGISRFVDFEELWPFVCMSLDTFVVSFLNGFGWNFGIKFGILFSLYFQINEKCEHFYCFITVPLFDHSTFFDVWCFLNILSYSMPNMRKFG
jgi:hypothetical protein